MERKGLYRSRGNKRKRRGREERRSASSSLCASLFLFLSFSLLLSLSLPISIASATTVGSTECLASLPQGTQVNLLFFHLPCSIVARQWHHYLKSRARGGIEKESKKREVSSVGVSLCTSWSRYLAVFLRPRVCGLLCSMRVGCVFKSKGGRVPVTMQVRRIGIERRHTQI